MLVTLIVYKLALIAIGLFFSRRTRDEADFFLGGRRLGPWVAAISASASSSSAWTLLGVCGAAYRWGLGALWLFPGCVGGFVLNWYLLAPRLRAHSHETGALTVTEVLAPRRERLSHTITVVASVIVLVSLLSYVAAQFQGAGKTFSGTFGLSMESSILLGAGIVVLYTMLGGFWAVSVTDTLQGFVMAVAAVVLPIGAFVAVGGVEGLAAGLAAVDVPGFSSLTRGMEAPLAVGFVAGLLGIGLGYPGQPHVVNRFMALRDQAAVVRGRRIALVWAVVVYAGMLMLGLCTKVLFPALDDAELAFLTATRELFPPVVAGVMVAAVLSAIMSTTDSQLLVAASSVSHDLRRDRAADTLSRSRLVVLLLSAAAVVAALYGSQEIFSRVLFAWAAMGSAFGPLLLVIVLVGPVPAPHRLAAMVAGFSLSVLAYFFEGGGALERVVPFFVALAIALWPKVTASRTERP
jgi:sodium/proline symporter